MTTDLFVIVAAGAFVIFLLWLRSESQAAPPYEPPYLPAAPKLEVVARRERDAETGGEEEVKYLDELPGPPLGQEASEIKLLNYSFAHLDWKEGPRDPEDFLDEIRIELYYAKTNERWLDTYCVASPKGLARYLRETREKCFSRDDLFVFERFDRELIINELRSYIVARIEADELQGERVARLREAEETSR